MQTPHEYQHSYTDQKQQQQQQASLAKKPQGAAQNMDDLDPKAKKAILVLPLDLKELSAVAGKASSLDALFQLTLQALKTACGPALEASVFPFTAFHFTARSIAHELLPAIVSRGSNQLFAPYIPQRFLAHYRAGRRLVSGLEALCPDDARAKTFADTPALAQFDDKWNLPVYFQLRFQEARKALEDAVRSPPSLTDQDNKMSPPSSSPLALSATRAVWTGVLRCWREDVWVDRLTHRFFKATLQLLKQYASWVSLGLGPPPPLERAGLSPPKHERKRSTASTQAGGGGKWSSAEASSLRLVIAVEKDIQALCSNVRHSLPGTIVGCVCGGHDGGAGGDAEKKRTQATEMVTSGLSGVIGELERAGARAREVAARRIALACTKNLVTEVPRIKQRYSMTGNAPPSTALAFVQSILTPLREQLEDDDDDDGDGRSKSAWLVSRVADLVTDRYRVAVSDLLAVVQKTEAILSRLKKKKGRAKGTGMSDADKIRLQLFLDVRRFAEDLAALGCADDTTKALQDLVQLPPSIPKPP
mmetsp:Transcript_6056/g.12008  ORF Transcript_6056/g.12008 Transcript_6056/m.12008 type:complete len:532 (+) Transcript_6056:86-1681(+)